MINYPNTLNFNGADVSKPIPGENQVKNNAGGYVYKIAPLDHAKRFCIIGSETGTYYVDNVTHTEDSAKNIISLINNGQGADVVNLALDVIKNGLSPKVDHSLFVLALCVKYGDQNIRKLVYSNLSTFCNIATHLFMFVNYVKSMRGIGRGLKNAIARWYLSKDQSRVLQQVLKYQNREGLSHRNMILCAHPKTNDKFFNSLFKAIIDIDNISKEFTSEMVLDWICKTREVNWEFYPFVKNLGKLENTNDIIAAIKRFGLTRENIPTRFLNDKEIWRALLEKMPYIALVRNINKLTSLGIIDEFSPDVDVVVEKLTNVSAIKGSKIHPMQLLLAIKVYSRGCGVRGSLSWNPNPRIVRALQNALEISFQNVEKINKNICFSVDYSGSMGALVDSVGTSAIDVGSMLAYVYSKTNDQTKFFKFDTRCYRVNVGDGSYKSFENVYSDNGGGTDLACSLEYVLEKVKRGTHVDALVIVTDNETWAGKHPVSILKKIRKVNPDFKMVTLSTVATPYSTFDTQRDPKCLDVVGFSADCIGVVNQFIEGNF